MRYPQVLKPILARPEGNLKSGLNTFSAPTPCGADDIQPIRPHAFVDEGMGPDLGEGWVYIANVSPSLSD
ncbi:hypothetical protein GA0061093_13728, partial [Rhodococcus qingshengii]